MTTSPPRAGDVIVEFTRYNRDGGVYSYRCACTGRELGSYVPATKSVRIGPRIYRPVIHAKVKRLFSQYARSLLEISCDARSR